MPIAKSASVWEHGFEGARERLKEVCENRIPLDARDREALAYLLVTSESRVDKARCFHEDAGKPSTRYLEGSEGERAEVSVDPEIFLQLDDEAMNAAWPKTVRFIQSLGVDPEEMLTRAAKRVEAMLTGPPPTRLDSPKHWGPDTRADKLEIVPVKDIIDICENERIYWNRRCRGGDLPPSDRDASDGWAAAENIAAAVIRIASTAQRTNYPRIALYYNENERFARCGTCHHPLDECMCSSDDGDIDYAKSKIWGK